MRNLRPLLLLFALLLGAITVSAAQNDEVQIARVQLEKQANQLSKISIYTKRIDLGRLMYIKRVIAKVQRSLEEKGLGNQGTIFAYQELIVACRHSADFFNRIATDMNKDSIAEFIQVADAIAKARGFDDSPYTQLTSSIFAQMHQIISDLIQTDLPQGLGLSLSELVTPMSKVIAIGRTGDRPKTFRAANQVLKQIRNFYPVFHQISERHSAFELILSLQGLSEFYADFAQVEDLS